MPNLGVIFATGLLTGGITCMAVQGSLLVSYVAARYKDEVDKKLGAGEIGMFLVAKLLSHLVLGLLLGLLGEKIKMTPIFSAAMQGVVGVYMLGVGLALLDVHPFFRRFLIQTPRFLSRYIRKTAKGGQLFAPAVLGAATIFIPCGTTQAMMALALATGSPWWGAAILGTFVLGTSPLFFGLGMALTKIGENWKAKFLKFSAWVVVIMAGVTINGALMLSGSNFTAQKVLARVECAVSYCSAESFGADNSVPAEELTITFLNNRYQVDNPVVKAGSKVKVNLVNKAGYGCIQAFTFPSLGISEVVTPGNEKQLEIVVPQKAGDLAFSCSMGMYGGELKIVN